MYKVFLILGLAAVLSISACSRQQSDWEKTRASNTTDAYELFIKKYPSGEFTAQAHARVKELYEERDWQKARDLDSADAYQAFLKQYPEGKWSDEARIRIENFTLAAAPPNGTPVNPPAASSTDVAAPAASSEPLPAAESTPKPLHNGAQKQSSNTAAAVQTTAADSYAIQLGAFKTGAGAANKRWKTLSARYPKLLGGLSPLVSSRKVSTGTMYRLQVVNLSGKHARAICQSLKTRSQACVVLRPAH